MRKQVLVYFDEDILNRLDQFIIRPTSRSDLLNDVIDYLLGNPDVLKTFVTLKNESLQRSANSITA